MYLLLMDLSRDRHLFCFLPFSTLDNVDMSIRRHSLKCATYDNSADGVYVIKPL